MRTTMRRWMGFVLSSLVISLLISLPVVAELRPQLAPESDVETQESAWAEQRAWIDQSFAKALRPTPEPDLWEVALADSGKAWRTFNFLRVVSSFDLVMPDRALADALAQAGYPMHSRQMVVGKVSRPSGRPRYVAALVVDFGRAYKDPEGAPARLFAAVLVTDVLEDATVFAQDMARIYNGEPATGLPASNRFGLKCGCEEACDAEFSTDIDLCTSEAILCVAISGAAAAACILACPPCSPACVAAQAAASALCLVQQQQCQRAAQSTWRGCIQGCIVVP